MRGTYVVVMIRRGKGGGGRVVKCQIFFTKETLKSDFPPFKASLVLFFLHKYIRYICDIMQLWAIQLQEYQI